MLQFFLTYGNATATNVIRTKYLRVVATVSDSERVRVYFRSNSIPVVIVEYKLLNCAE